MPETFSDWTAFEIPTVEHLTYPWAKRVSVVNEISREEYESKGMQIISNFVAGPLNEPEMEKKLEEYGIYARYFTGQTANWQYTLECVLLCLKEMNIFDEVAVSGLHKTKSTVVVCFKKKVDPSVYQSVAILLSYCIEDYFDCREVKIYMFNGTKEEVLKGIENHPAKRKITEILKKTEKRVENLKKAVILHCNDKGVSYA